jgi:S-adenosylmethionine synthetase
MEFFMSSNSYVWTSEYVSPGHPDKVADQISDAILDAYLTVDPDAKVACETLVKGNNVYLAGEISSKCELNNSFLESAVRDTIIDIGYDSDEHIFNGTTCNIHFDISKQSSEINGAVVSGDGEIAAGDQGIMFGYATNETPTNMPLPIYLAKQFIMEAYNGINSKYAFRPDMKSQISINFEGGSAKSIHSVVFSTCHTEELSLKNLRDVFHSLVLPNVLETLPENIQNLFNRDTKYYINPAGTWNIGGPVSDSGLTGRKIVVDQYGADCEIGGGAFSGKDPSKVDRSAAYMARHIALTTLQNNPDAEKIKVQLAYAIGERFPVSYRIYNPENGKEYGLGDFNLEDLTPTSIIDILGLKNPIYAKTAKYGHFGNKPLVENGIEYFKWENQFIRANTKNQIYSKNVLSHSATY